MEDEQEKNPMNLLTTESAIPILFSWVSSVFALSTLTEEFFESSTIFTCSYFSPIYQKKKKPTKIKKFILSKKILEIGFCERLKEPTSVYSSHQENTKH